MTITITLDSDNPSKLRVLAKFMEELANLSKNNQAISKTSIHLDEIAKPYIDGSAVNLPYRPNNPNAQKYELLELADLGTEITLVPEEPIANVATEKTEPYEFDASGLPWDARLHSRTKSKTTEGMWRRQRGLSPSKANKLELEVRASITDAQKIAHEESKVDVAPPPPPFTHVQAPPPPPIVPTEDKYIALVKKITTAVESEKLTYEKVKDILMQFGIADLAALKNVPHLYAVIDQQVNEVARA